nr:hypothetical protein BaRGS_007279 [Batillaria attramentaria]
MRGWHRSQQTTVELGDSLQAKPKKSKSQSNRKTIPPMLLDTLGRPVFPMVLGDLTLHSIGEIVPDRNTFHTQLCIYPVGFCSTRVYASMTRPQDKCLYTCKISDAGDQPEFEIAPEEGTEQVFRGTTPNECHVQLQQAINAVVGADLLPGIGNGADFFGLTNPVVQNLIQSCPGSKKCSGYKWIKFEINKAETNENMAVGKNDPTISIDAFHRLLSQAEPFCQICSVLTIASAKVLIGLSPRAWCGLRKSSVNLKTYTLDVEGPKKVLKFTYDDLIKLPKKSVAAVVQCAGNRRSDMVDIKPVKGLNWGAAAIGNAEWSGVRLSDLLKQCGINLDTTTKKHLVFEGMDKGPEGSVYGASIPIELAKSLKDEIILAYEMNGKQIPRDHGYPVRVIIPGVVGARQVKWLNKIYLSDEESECHWQRRDYKGFNSSIDWHNVDFDSSVAIMQLPVVSAICDPPAGTELEEGSEDVTVRGYAWSGGGRGIIRVDVSADGGKTWHTAELQPNGQTPYRAWAWTLWEATVPLPEGHVGPVELVCKAVDVSYNVQPDGVEGDSLWPVRDALKPVSDMLATGIDDDDLPQVIDRDDFFKNVTGILSLELSHNGLSRIGDHVFGLLENLTELELAFNELDYANLVPAFSVTTLTHLNIFANNLGPLPDGIFHSADMFPERLVNLFLDNNKISHIPDGVFDSLKYVKVVSLPKNAISTVGETTFSPALRQRMSLLDLSDNPFLCSCELRWFREWLVSDPGKFNATKRRYVCDNLPGTSVQTFFLADQACVLSREASIFIITSIVLINVAFFLGTLLFSYRWHLRLVLYEAFRGQGERLKRLQQEHFDYDVFVSYPKEDFDFVREHLMPELEEGMGLRLCIHERDFIPGQNIVDNISDCVNSSKKVMMLFSTSFARSEWCQFELNFCLRHVMEHDDALLVLIMHDIPSRDLTTAMMAVMKTTTYIEWADEPDARESFWRRIHIALSEILPDA